MVFGVGIEMISARAPVPPEDTAFTARERALLERKDFPEGSRRARLAGKRAVCKALRAPEDVPLREVELLDGPWGAPESVLSGSLAALAAARGVGRVELSLSFEEDSAVAAAIAFAD